MKNYEQQVRAGPYETHLNLLPGAYGSQAPPLPQKLGDEPLLRCWLEQTVNSIGSLEFLRQVL